jgi:hypothetical protein
MDRVSNLLAQFPGPLILRPSKWKWLGFLAVAGLFTASGIVQNVESGSAGILSWVGVAFFGLLTVCAAIAIFIADFSMLLDGDGFTLRVARRSERWRWIDVGDFAVVQYLPGMQGAGLRKRVGFNDKRLDKGTSQRVGERLSIVLTGRECALPDAYGSSAFGLPMEDLARLMSQWQERAIARRRPPAGHEG